MFAGGQQCVLSVSVIGRKAAYVLEGCSVYVLEGCSVYVRAVCM